MLSVMSGSRDPADCVQPGRLLRPWDLPGRIRSGLHVSCRISDPGIELRSLASPALASKILYPHHLGSPYKVPAWSFSVLLLTVRQRENAPERHVRTFPRSSATLLRPTQLSRWPCFWFRKNKTLRNRLLPFLFSLNSGEVAQPPVTFSPSHSPPPTVQSRSSPPCPLHQLLWAINHSLGPRNSLVFICL